MFRSLQSLRGLFALGIFAHHFFGFEAGGDCGVSFFLILSGFVLCNGFEDRICRGEISYGRFVCDRLSKIYPLHVLCLAAAIAVQLPVLTAADILPDVSNLLLLQAWIPDSSYYFSGNSISWFLSALLFAYLLFPPLVHLPGHLGLRGTASGICAMLTVYFIAVYFTQHMVNNFIYVNPMMRLTDFVLGMFLWQIWRRGCDSRAVAYLRARPAAVRTLAEGAAIAVFAGALMIYAYIPPQYSAASLWWMPSMLLIGTFTVLDARGGLFTRLLHLRPLISFGNVSFSFYMIHIVAGEYLRVLLEKLGIPVTYQVFVWILLFLTIAASYPVSRWFERPAAALWRRYFCR